MPRISAEAAEMEQRIERREERTIEPTGERVPKGGKGQQNKSQNVLEHGLDL